MFGFLDKIEDKGNYYIINNFPRLAFLKALERRYKTVKLQYLMDSKGIVFFKNKSIRVHKFFLPELVYLLDTLHFPNKLIRRIIDNTWLSECEKEVKPKVDLSIIPLETHIKPQIYQEEFVKNYEKLKSKFQLKGLILSFEQGLGKTITSLLLMACLKKDKVFIFAPNRLLETVWVPEINKVFKEKKRIYVANRDILHENYDYYILNYESLEKCMAISSDMKKYDIGIIIDESHNFLTLGSKRTDTLIQFINATNCQDVLPMSGTPLKALGIEIIPMLLMLDRYFDEEAIDIYKKALGVKTMVATDIIHSRLNVMMHRKRKEEVLKLPPKTETTIKVKIPNGSKYTLTSVKQLMLAFAKERFAYHKENMDKYRKMFYDALDYAESKGLNDRKFKDYLGIVKSFQKRPPNMQLASDREAIKWTNEYEKSTIIPILDNKYRKDFLASKAAVKYLHLKIQGEVLGSCLGRLRIDMVKEMVEYANLPSIIDGSIKKTLIFTNFVEAVNVVLDYLKGFKFQPIAVFADTNKHVKDILNKFKTDKKINPLVATIQSLSTGATLVEASTVVFLNRPWRSIDYEQTAARAHRIGQDCAVEIITLLLDTGTELNLAERMYEINDWSANMVSAMVDGV